MIVVAVEAVTYQKPHHENVSKIVVWGPCLTVVVTASLPTIPINN